MPDQAEPLRQLLREQKTKELSTSSNLRLIAVASGKGGVGKSNITLNLGLLLAQQGMRIAILDADFGFANLDILLGVRPHYSLMDVLDGHVTLQQAFTHGPYNLAFISGGAEHVFELNSRSIYGKRLTEQLIAVQGEYDRIYIDFGAGFGTFTAELMGLCDELLLVTTPEPTALADAYALLKMVAKTLSLPPVHLLINRAAKVADGMDAGRKLTRVTQQFLHAELNVLGYVLEDAAVQRAVAKQTPFTLSEPRSLATRCMSQIAKNVTKGVYESSGESLEKKRGLQGFFQRFLRESH